MKKIKNIRGQSVAELALVLPIFLIILMGIVEFGLLMSDYVIVVNAAREGTRVAALGGTEDDVIAKVEEVTSTLQDSNISITITPNEYERERGEAITVEVAYVSEPIMPLIKNISPELYNIKSKMTMRIE
ncbi:MAG: hypothetical protein A2Y24_02115 [Clostridiales bacterium GWE2_32_10]|nr:MAG: hypothetical protein A2Y24_02115 [Clostridiales bacterium GWE2_32_10]HBY20526.1 pilus assembly protein TadG [Clostridiales bacterium]